MESELLLQSLKTAIEISRKYFLIKILGLNTGFNYWEEGFLMERRCLPQIQGNGMHTERKEIRRQVPRVNSEEVPDAGAVTAMSEMPWKQGSRERPSPKRSWKQTYKEVARP